MLITLLILLAILLPINLYILYKIKIRNEKKFFEKIKKIDLKKIIILNLGYIIVTITFQIFLKNIENVLIFTTAILVLIIKQIQRTNQEILENFGGILEKYFMIIFIIICLVRSILEIIFK
ncbi:hypothetical protein [uncultured Sneathia sp.]|uniref:hypothetical protein n=1 Tax=uncultured Sneathia sp. TaxID=278067 RepID=UPI0025939553|nr:hypothetical protein [uncultured Sneathia sp.]